MNTKVMVINIPQWEDKIVREYDYNTFEMVEHNQHLRFKLIIDNFNAHDLLLPQESRTIEFDGRTRELEKTVHWRVMSVVCKVGEDTEHGHYWTWRRVSQTQ